MTCTHTLARTTCGFRTRATFDCDCNERGTSRSAMNSAHADNRTAADNRTLAQTLQLVTSYAPRHSTKTNTEPLHPATSSPHTLHRQCESIGRMSSTLPVVECGTQRTASQARSPSHRRMQCFGLHVLRCGCVTERDCGVASVAVGVGLAAGAVRVALQ